MTEAESEEGFQGLVDYGGEKCDRLLDHCQSLHSKVEILRRTVFRLDDLVYSIKSACVHLRDHRLKRESWNGRIVSCLDEGKECDVGSKLDDFSARSTEVYNCLLDRVETFPSEDELNAIESLTDELVVHFDKVFSEYENESKDTMIVDQFNEMLRAKRDIESTLDTLQGISHSSSSNSRPKIDVVDVENWVPDDTVHINSNGYNQPGRQRTTRNSSGGLGLRQFLRPDLDAVAAVDGEGDHATDSDYSESAEKGKRTRGAKGGKAALGANRMSSSEVNRVFKGGVLTSTKKGGRPAKKGAAAAAAAASKKKPQPPKQSNSMKGFITTESDAEREEIDAHQQQHGHSSRSSGWQHRSRDAVDEDDINAEDSDVGVDNSREGGSEGVYGDEHEMLDDDDAVLEATMLKSKQEAEGLEECIFPYFSEKEAASNQKQVALVKTYGTRRHSINGSSSSGAAGAAGGHTSASSFVVIHGSNSGGSSSNSRTKQVPDVVDLCELTQPSVTHSTSSGFVTSPSSTTPVGGAAAAAGGDSVPSRALRSTDQLLADHDNAATEMETHPYFQLYSLTAPTHARSRSNSNTSADGVAAAANVRRSTKPVPPLNMSQDAEFDEPHSSNNYPTTTPSSRVGVFKRPTTAGYSMSPSAADGSSSSGGAAAAGVSATQSSHISPISIHKAHNLLHQEGHDYSKPDGTAGSYWEPHADSEAEEQEDNTSLQSIEIVGDIAGSSSGSAGKASAVKVTYVEDTVMETPKASSILGTMFNSFAGIFSSGGGIKRTIDEVTPTATHAITGGSVLSGRELRASKRAHVQELQQQPYPMDGEDEDWNKDVEAIEAVHQKQDAERLSNMNKSSNSSSSSSGSSGSSGVNNSGTPTVQYNRSSGGGVIRSGNDYEPAASTVYGVKGSGQAATAAASAVVRNNGDTSSSSSNSNKKSLRREDSIEDSDSEDDHVGVRNSIAASSTAGGSVLAAPGTLNMVPSRSATPNRNASAHSSTVDLVPDKPIFSSRAKRSVDASSLSAVAVTVESVNGARSSNRRNTKGNSDVIDLVE